MAVVGTGDLLWNAVAVKRLAQLMLHFSFFLYKKEFQIRMDFLLEHFEMEFEAETWWFL